jgi:hypothetical protein
MMTQPWTTTATEDGHFLTKRVKMRSHRGGTLVAAIVCILIIMLCSSAVVQTITMQRSAARLDEQRLQCLLLAESAVGRAKAQCARDPDFKGETWRVPLQSNGTKLFGVSEIEVEPVVNEPRQRRVQIKSRWPDDPIYSVLLRKDVVITLLEPGAPS